MISCKWNGAVQYHAPTDLNEALALMAASPVAVVAGGTDYFPARRPGKPDRDILDITRIEGLRGIWQTGSDIRFGAATRWGEIATMDLPQCFDGLRQAARSVGSLQIQNAGTIGGNLCNASPAADGVPPLLTLDASVELAGPTGIRRLPLSEFLTGPRQTQLGAGELLTALTMPRPPCHARGVFDKLGSRRYLVISIAMVAGLIGCDSTGRIDLARIAVGACSPVARRLTALEQDLLGFFPGEVDITETHLSPLTPIADVRGSAEFRLEAVAEQIRRIVRGAA